MFQCFNLSILSRFLLFGELLTQDAKHLINGLLLEVGILDEHFARSLEYGTGCAPAVLLELFDDPLVNLILEIVEVDIILQLLFLVALNLTIDIDDGIGEHGGQTDVQTALTNSQADLIRIEINLAVLALRIELDAVDLCGTEGAGNQQLRVRGPLDDILADGEDVLRSGADDNGTLYFICKLDSKEEVDDEANWTKANPSLPYLPDLQLETRKEYKEWKKNPDRLPAFMSKRMNLPESAKESAVAEWDAIAGTNQEIPDLKGWNCTVGIDYASTTDWVAVNLHFRKGNDRYDINKAWMCSASRDIPRIKAPWQEWCKTEYLEYVDDIEIHPSIPANYIYEMGKIYNITMVAIDSYRYSLLSDALSKVGISKEKKNLMLVRQTDIIKVVPVIDHCFLNGYFHWGDNPVLRWGTNNTKTIRYGRDVGADKGSFVYAKIEAKSRKNDTFMSLVASMVPENEIKERPATVRVPVIKL